MSTFSLFPEGNAPLSGDSTWKLLQKIAGSLYNITGSGSAPVTGDSHWMLLQRIAGSLSGSGSGSGSGGSVPATAWVTKTANYTLVAGDKIAADSTAGAFTLVLPTPTGSGAQIDILDPQGSWATHNVAVTGTVNGISGLSLNLAGSTVRLVDVGGTAGWRAN